MKYIIALAFVIICLTTNVTAKGDNKQKPAVLASPKELSEKEWKRLTQMREWVPSDRCRREWTARHYPVLDVQNRAVLKQLLRGRALLFLGDSTSMYKVFRLVGMLEKVRGMRSRMEAINTDKQRIVLTWNRAPFIKLYFTTTYFAELPLIPPGMDYTHIIFNIGLHWLQLWPARELALHAVFHSYRVALAAAFHELSTKAPRAKIMYVLTSAICSAKYKDHYARAAAMWLKATATSPIVRQAALTALKLQAQAFKKGLVDTSASQHNISSISDWFLEYPFTNVGCQNLNKIAIEEVNRFNNNATTKSRIEVIDDYALTNDMCACTTDARHYPDLAPAMIAKFLPFL